MKHHNACSNWKFTKVEDCSICKNMTADERGEVEKVIYSAKKTGNGQYWIYKNDERYVFAGKQFKAYHLSAALNDLDALMVEQIDKYSFGRAELKPEGGCIIDLGQGRILRTIPIERK